MHNKEFAQFVEVSFSPLINNNEERDFLLLSLELKRNTVIGVGNRKPAAPSLPHTEREREREQSSVLGLKINHNTT